MIPGLNRACCAQDKISAARVKFNQAGAYNKELRGRIDNLRRERVVFDGIYRRVEKELQDKKAEMAQVGLALAPAQTCICLSLLSACPSFRR